MGFQQRASQEQPVSAAPSSFVIGWAVVDANQIIEMLRKNVASQVVTFNLVNATTGAALTGASVTTKVALDGTQSAGAGTVTELGTGQYKYVPTQGETNGASVGFSFTATNAVPVNLQCFTIGQDPTLATFDSNITKLLGTAWLTPGTAGTPDVNVKLWNALSTVALPLIPTVAGRTLDVSAGGEAGVDWANVGSPTTSLALTGTTIAVTQKVDVDTIKTNPVVNGGTITFPTTATLASTTNITAGTITTATTATNLTNAPTNGDFTAAMKTSIGTAVAASAVASVTGAVGSIASGGITDASFAAGTGKKVVRANTAAAGAAGTITLDAGASATDSIYNGLMVYLTGATGVGQVRTITGYVGSTQVATVDRNWQTNPDNTSTFALLPNDGPKVDSSLQVIAASVTGAVGSVTGAVGSVTGAVGSVTGNVGGSVASVAAGGIANTSFAAAAIDAAAIATDAIGSAELAAGAVTKVWANACTEPTAAVAASPTAIAALSWLLTLSRNLITQTATTQLLKADDGSTTVATSTVSDDGTTFSRGEFG